jgi:hypothetical protein
MDDDSSRGSERSFDSLDKSKWHFKNRSSDRLICNARNLCNYETNTACGNLATVIRAGCKDLAAGLIWSRLPGYIEGSMDI